MRLSALSALLLFYLSITEVYANSSGDSTGIPSSYNLSGYTYDGGDSDGDGIRDGSDNCPNDPNPDQADADGDGIGDVCDGSPNGSDSDGDGIPDANDNCPSDSNPDQADSDSDGIGDVCDPTPDGSDSDGDGVPDASDNCPDDANADQLDTDGDGIGDVCDASPNGSDVDGDGVPDANDNCPNDANPDQADADGDGFGDVCDSTPNGPDSDGDGVPDSSDNCPDDANSDQADTDGDGLGDVCDSTPNGDVQDADGDGISDADDNCPNTPNSDQADVNSDGEGDVCDDTDFDGHYDSTDNCRLFPNANQSDHDGDGIGDMCESGEPTGCTSVGDVCSDGTVNLGGGKYLSADFGVPMRLSDNQDSFILPPLATPIRPDTGAVNYSMLTSLPSARYANYQTRTLPDWCAGNPHGHDDWTVMSRDELIALVDDVDLSSFVNASYWTSTPSDRSTRIPFTYLYAVNPYSGAEQELLPNERHYGRCIRELNADLDRDNIANRNEIAGCARVPDLPGNQSGCTATRNECSTPGDVCRNGAVYVGRSPSTNEPLVVAHAGGPFEYAWDDQLAPRNGSTTDGWQDIYDDHMAVNSYRPQWVALDACESLTRFGKSDWHMLSLGEAMQFGTLEKAWEIGYVLIGGSLDVFIGQSEIGEDSGELHNYGMKMGSIRTLATVTVDPYGNTIYGNPPAAAICVSPL